MCMSYRTQLLLQEICGDPQLFVDGANRMDINQGALGKKVQAYCARVARHLWFD